MNEEEKKTIEKFIEKCYKYDESVEIKGISVGEEYRMLNTVCKALNLIEKLQKENRRLKTIRYSNEWGTESIHLITKNDLVEINTNKYMIEIENGKFVDLKQVYQGNKKYKQFFDLMLKIDSDYFMNCGDEETIKLVDDILKLESEE